ncbi:uncharacterized protein TNCV_3650671 [Trichonephila clavipes]|uniref:Uncharacterized protein n=1 Tax=Trichonephila clavipes TaxID=2585209 RepID=A0A8X6SAA5_TRICX|nr:uncharacterized protein TNCV_3650671 [Trichonephila clavipes]
MHPHTTVVIQYALQSADVLLWPARSPDFSPIGNKWNIIGRLPQRHSTKIKCSVLDRLSTVGMQFHPTNLYPVSERHIACMHAFKILVVTPISNAPSFHI